MWKRCGRSWGLLIALALIACGEEGSATDAKDGRSGKGAGVETIIRAGRASRDGGGDQPAAAGANPAAGGATPSEPRDAAGSAGGASSTAGSPASTQADGGTGTAPEAADAAIGPDHPLPNAPVIPDDPGATGPWPVGVRTLLIDLGNRQSMPVEVWYPAVPGSEAGKDKVVYDLGKWLPPEAQQALPSGALPVPWTCNCYRDLPPDLEHGPYPVSLLVHEIAQFRIASSGILAHWASRGFIAVAADHPGHTLADWCAINSRGRCTGSGVPGDTQHTRDVPRTLETLRGAKGDFAFLAGAIDATHMAVSGSLQGAPYAAAASGEPGVRLVMMWNATTAVSKRGDLAGVLYLATKATGLLAFDPAPVQDRFWAVADTIKPAFYVAVNATGPLSFTSFCNAKNAAGQTGMDLGYRYSFCGIDFTAERLVWDCNQFYLEQPEADHVFGHATTAALEEVLKGRDGTRAWSQFKSEWGDVHLVR